jgi:2-amino-4-hydroxy-6-hydroxymethyldihydropteridine diphosphokinase
MSKKTSQVFIALGSNLENPIFQIQQAFEELKQRPGIRLISQSSLYKSAPVGRLDQPDFINAVTLVETHLTPHGLLNTLLIIEHNHGRVRESLNAPRTLDLDILLYDDLECHDEKLTLPHPRMSQRAFVLKPLMEIAPDCCIPGLGHIAPLLAACDGQKLEQIKV